MSKIFENRVTKNFSITDDKTPVQRDKLKKLRQELDFRKNND